MLANGESIAVTHSTFLNATPETLELIHEGEYTLILDEALDVICEFNKVQSVESSPRQSVSGEDIAAVLLGKKLIKIDERYKVYWCGSEHTPEFKFYEVMRLAKLGRLYCVRGKLFVTVYPPEMFQQFNAIYVLTYMFDGCFIKSYFELFALDYSMVNIAHGDRGYGLIPYCPDADIAFRQQCKQLITICDSVSLNKQRTLSKLWYSKATPDKISQLKNDIGNYFNRVLKNARASNGDIMWTCPAEFEKKLSGKGYTCVRSMTEDDKRLPEQERKKREKELSCFVPCNAKATNIYGKRWALAYCCNMYQNPMIMGFFADCNIFFDENAFALSCLVQWICRSRLRNCQPISIYIPSRRMRNLLLDWMG